MFFLHKYLEIRFLFIGLCHCLFLSPQLTADQPLYPYRFDLINVDAYNNVFEAKVIPDKYPNLIFFSARLDKPQQNLVITDLDTKTFDSINSEDGEQFYPQIFPYDIDNDQFEEILYVGFKNYEIRIYLYDPSNSVNEKSHLLTLPSDREIYKGKIDLKFFQFDNDSTYEMLISLGSEYPQDNAIRGIFAFDAETKKILWFYPTAYWISEMKVIQSELKENIITFSACGWANGMAYSNGTFFRLSKNEIYLPDTTVIQKGDAGLLRLDTLAVDYSNDNTSAIVTLDKNGKKMWERKFGGPFSCTILNTIKAKAETQLTTVETVYSATVESKDILYIMNPYDGTINNQLDFSEAGLSGQAVHNNKIYVALKNKALQVYDQKLKLTKEAYFENLKELPYIFSTPENTFVVINTIDNKLVFLDENFKIAGIPEKFGGVKYLSSINQVAIIQKDISRYSMVFLKWWQRISRQTLIKIAFISAGLIIVILILWAITILKSRKWIRIQKEALEESQQKLTETMGMLIQQEKMASLGNLVAGVAHEINSPSGVIHSAVDVLNRCISKIENDLKNAVSENDQSLQRSLELIKENNQLIRTAESRIVTIISSLRNFARLDEEPYQKVNLHEGLDSTLTLLEHELANRISVEKKYGEIPPTICYPGQINQVFMSVLMNAIQAIENTGEIQIETMRADDKIFVTISDTGKGIPPEKLSFIFDFGFTDKRTRIGLGVGLPSSYKIIKEHNGDIKINSEVGKGTEVTIALPIT